MVFRRIEYGRLSFELPEGFYVLEEASLLAPQNGADQDTDLLGIPITVTLMGTTAQPDVPDYSESASDMTPDAYPTSIALSLREPGEPPMAFLRNMEKVMKCYFTGYKIHFFENTRINDFSAARSQSAYQSNFKIYRLNYAWHTDHKLVTACLTVPESRVRDGWDTLRDFVLSVNLSTKG